MAELINGLKKAGLPEHSAVRFAAIWFAESTGNVVDPDDD